MPGRDERIFCGNSVYSQSRGLEKKKKKVKGICLFYIVHPVILIYIYEIIKKE